MSLVGQILGFLISAYLLVLTARAVLSFVPLINRDFQPRGVLLVICEFVYTLTDPPLRLLGKVIPPLTVGSMRLDMGFIVLWMLLIMIARFIPAFF
ncbi:MAG: YggT family protein [Propionibacteriaceae bacterium]|jgi:YggT family protein|nr:YggT family protein [Propionibacteriaceae bacterium]